MSNLPVILVVQRRSRDFFLPMARKVTAELLVNKPPPPVVAMAPEGAWKCENLEGCICIFFNLRVQNYLRKLTQTILSIVIAYTLQCMEPIWWIPTSVGKPLQMEKKDTWLQGRWLGLSLCGSQISTRCFGTNEFFTKFANRTTLPTCSIVIDQASWSFTSPRVGTPFLYSIFC